MNAQSMRFTPWMNAPPRNISGSPTSMSGSWVSISVKIARSWVRASDAPRQ